MNNDAQVWRGHVHHTELLEPGYTYYVNAYVKNGVSRVGYFYVTRERAELGARWSGILNCRIVVHPKKMEPLVVSHVTK